MPKIFPFGFVFSKIIRLCPPPPNVQSIALSFGFNSSNSITSLARTGMCIHQVQNSNCKVQSLIYQKLLILDFGLLTKLPVPPMFQLCLCCLFQFRSCSSPRPIHPKFPNDCTDRPLPLVFLKKRIFLNNPAMQFSPVYQASHPSLPPASDG